MAEIALLVAEEFENGRRRAEEDGIEAINRMAKGCASAMVKKVEKGLELLMQKEAKMRAVCSDCSIGFAASDGLFSA